MVITSFITISQFIIPLLFITVQSLIRFIRATVAVATIITFVDSANILFDARYVV
jgi:hypothetical protein